MTEEQVKKYERLSSLKRQYERFIESEGDVAMSFYCSDLGRQLQNTIFDKEFTSLVKSLAEKRLESINKQIAEI